MGGGGYDGGGISCTMGEEVLSLEEEEARAVWHKLETMEVVIVKVLVEMVT